MAFLGRAALVVVACLLFAESAGAQPIAAPPPAAGALTPPRVVTEAKPPYPEGGTGEASVEIEMVIDERGAPRELKLVSGSPPFTGPAFAAAAQYRFAPALRDGSPVPARFRVRINFTPPPKPVDPPSLPPPVTPPPPPVKPPPVDKPAEPGEPTPIEVTIEGERSLPAREPSKTTIDAKTLQRIPGAFGDAFRAIEILPGVVPFASGLPYFFVRGALPSSSGYYYDGIKIPFLFHVGIGPSVINPALVDKVDFYPGGYPAQYGRFIGGIISASSPPPSDHPRGEALIRLYDAGAFIESPFLGGNASVFAAARYSYTAPLLQLAAPTLRLNYWDYQTGLSYKLTPHDRVVLFAFGSSDHLGKVDPKDTPEQDLFGAQFHRLQLRLDHNRNVEGAPQTTLALTLGMDKSVVTGQGTVTNPLIGLRSDSSVPLSREVTIRGGTELNADRYDFEASDDPVSPDPTDFHHQIISSFESRTRGAFGSWVDVVIRPIPAIELIPGIRLDAFAENGVGKIALDPRFTARVKLGPRVTSVTTVGVAHQWPSIAVPIPGLEPELLGDGLQSVVAESQGIEVALPESILATVTAFHHGYDNLTDILATCGPEVATCLLADRAGGRAYGMEVSASRPLSKDIGGIFSYTLSRAERSFNGHTFVSDFDRTHVINLAVGWAFAKNWHAGARLTTYSGRPYSKTAQDDPTSPDSPTLIGKRNALRRAWFYRIDLRLERQWQIGKAGYISLLIEAMNVTLSKETVDFDCRVSDFNGDTAGLKCGGEEIGPVFIPSIGVAAGF